jgi:MFS family permease
VYALLFAASGLTEGEIALLFGIWTVVGVVAEVPSGAWADRFSRRSALVTGGLLRSAGFALWIVWPEFIGFAAGFVLWGLGGALQTGAFEALVYDGLDAAGAADRYVGLMGRARSAGLITEMLALAAATPLLLAGGYALVGWVSVAVSLLGVVVATRLPEVRGAGDPAEAEVEQLTYGQVLRAGLAELLHRPGVLAAALAVMLVTGLDAVEEFSPLLAVTWGVPEGIVPVVVAGLSLSAGAATAFSGVAAKLPVGGVSAVVAGAAVALAAASLTAHPASMLGFAVWHGLLRLAIVLLDARLQDAITGPARATVTSVASLGSELSALPVLAAYAGGGVTLVAALALLTAGVIVARRPRWLRLRR